MDKKRIDDIGVYLSGDHGGYRAAFWHYLAVECYKEVKRLNDTQAETATENENECWYLNECGLCEDKEIKRLSEENANLKTKVKELKKQHPCAYAQVDSYNNPAGCSLVAKLEEYKAEIERLSTENANLKTRLKQDSSELKGLKQLLSEKGEKVLDQQEEIKRLNSLEYYDCPCFVKTHEMWTNNQHKPFVTLPARCEFMSAFMGLYDIAGRLLEYLEAYAESYNPSAQCQTLITEARDKGLGKAQEKNDDS